LVATLNKAVSLVQQADSINGTNPSRAQALYAQASVLAAQVIQASTPVENAGRASVESAQIVLVVETVILTGIAVITYVYTPKLFWTLWLRAHKNWRLKKV
jgi:hypothetical protein